MFKSKIVLLLIIAALSLSACSNNVAPPPASSNSSIETGDVSSDVPSDTSGETSSDVPSEASIAPESKTESVPESKAESVPPASKASSAPPASKAESVPPASKASSAPPVSKAESAPPASKAESAPPVSKAESPPPAVKAESPPPVSSEASVSSAAPQSAAPRTVNLPTQQPGMEAIADAIFVKVNELRASLGLAAYSRNSLLDDSALIRSAEMYAANNMSHTRPNGELFQTTMDAVGYKYDDGKENIGNANHFPLDQLAETFFEGWRNSPSHYEAMIAPHLTEIGIALYGDVPNCFATQHFGHPA